MNINQMKEIIKDDGKIKTIDKNMREKIIN